MYYRDEPSVGGLASFEVKREYEHGKATRPGVSDLYFRCWHGTRPFLTFFIRVSRIVSTQGGFISPFPNDNERYHNYRHSILFSVFLVIDESCCLRDLSTSLCNLKGPYMLPHNVTTYLLPDFHNVKEFFVIFLVTVSPEAVVVLPKEGGGGGGGGVFTNGAILFVCLI
jgi:hypothetical protein